MASRSASGAVYVPSQTHITSAPSPQILLLSNLFPNLRRWDVGAWTSVLPHSGAPRACSERLPDRGSSEIQCLEYPSRHLGVGGWTGTPAGIVGRPRRP